MAVVMVAALPAAAVQADSTDYMARGMSAQAAGDLEGARRAYILAFAQAQDAGQLGTDARYALAHVLHLQGRHRGAADVVSALATDASRAGDTRLAARAHRDAAYLYDRAHRPVQAREQAEQLAVLTTR